nr:GNAT family N-acetyltransferase [Bacillus sp. REN10]
MKSLTSKCRNRVRYAMKQGLTVHKEESVHLDCLIDQYMKTMKKNQADDYYFFSRKFFEDTLQLLEGSVDLFTVKYQDQVIASAIFLRYGEYVSYHLTGSDQQYLHLAPYNLLILTAAMEFGKQGYKYLHLGGGYNGNDDLLRFKKTFIKNDPIDFYIGKKIHNTHIYHRLTQHVDEKEDYFPLYRQPLLKQLETV